MSRIVNVGKVVPVRGIDYWTEADQEQIVDDVFNSKEIQQVENDVQTANNNSNEAVIIARGKARSKVFDTLAEMQAYISDVANKGYLQVGDNLYIKAVNVPDYFVSAVLETPNASGYYYEYSPLGSEVPDLTDYVKNTDYATSAKAGVSIFNNSYGISITSSGYVYTSSALASEITAKTNQFKPIVPSNLDYAIEKGLGNNSLTWTDDEKQSARTTIGSIGKTDIAGQDKLGLSSYNNYYGVSAISTGMAYIVQATNADIDSKNQLYRPIVPSNLNYAVRSVLPLTSDTIPATLVAQTEYYVGSQTSLTYALPNTGILGQYCFVSFVSGTTATTLSVSGNVVGDTVTPVASKTYEVLYTWNGSAWVCSYRAY